MMRQVGSHRQTDHDVAQADKLILSLQLEEAGPPVRLSVIAFTLVLMVVTAIVWAGFTRIDEVVQAPGETVPDGEVLLIQHADGGVVQAINVAEADRVKAGDVLLQFAPVRIETEISRLEAQRDQVLLSLQREQAVSSGEALELEAGADPDQIAEQSRLHVAQLESRQRQVETQQALIDEAQAEIQTILAQIPDAEAARDDLAEEEDAIAQLYDRGHASRERNARARREARAAASRVDQLRAELALQQRKKGSAQARLAELVATQQTDALSRSAALISELAALDASIIDAEDRFDRLTVRAPVDGVVTQLSSRHVGAVVAPGQELMQVVPEDRRLVVHARVQPGDIGRVVSEQAVSIRVGAYDHTQFGSIEGRISRISPTTFVDEGGLPYYQVTIEPEREFFGAEHFGARLLPGMTVEADIKNNQRSLLSYLMRPVTRGWTTAFREK